MKKIVLIFLLAVFLIFLFSDFCFAQRRLEIEYPPLPGVETPMTTKTALPEYLRYIFTFAIIIAGLLAFFAMVFGGIKYLTSAGAPAAMADARDQITSGILGLIIILTSFLILNTINPQLIVPKKPPLMATVAGIRIYSKTGCDDSELAYPSYKVIQNIPKLSEIKSTVDTEEKGWGTGSDFSIKSIKFFGEPGDVIVKIYRGDEFTRGTSWTGSYEAGEDRCLSDFNGTLGEHRSIKLIWHIPGVYLYPKTGCDGDPKIYQASSATLPGFNDQTQSIKFRDETGREIISKGSLGEAQSYCKNKYVGPPLLKGVDEIEAGKRYACVYTKNRYAAVLHEHENWMGKADLYEQSEKEGCSNTIGGVSSITVYLKPELRKVGDAVGEKIIGEGVRFWGDKNYAKEVDDVVLPSETTYYPVTITLPSGKEITIWESSYVGDANNDKITSMEIDGHYIALLFQHSHYGGDCEVFTSSDPDFRDNRIGQKRCGIFWLFRCDDLSSFKIRARK